MKKEMNHECMLDALEHGYHVLMNFGDIYGARGLETVMDELHLKEVAVDLAAKRLAKIDGTTAEQARGDLMAAARQQMEEQPHDETFY